MMPNTYSKINIEICGKVFQVDHIEIKEQEQQIIEIGYMSTMGFVPGRLEQHQEIGLYVSNTKSAMEIRELLDFNAGKKEIIVGDLTLKGCWVDRWEQTHYPNEGSYMMLHITCDGSEGHINIQPPAEHINLDFTIGEVVEEDPEDRIMGTRKLDL